MATPKPTSARALNRPRWERMRTRVFTEEHTCHLCGQAVDTTLPALDPGAPELDHITPVSRGGDTWDRSNYALSHRLCNQRKGNRYAAPTSTAPQQPAAAVGLVPYSPEWNRVMFPTSREW